MEAVATSIFTTDIVTKADSLKTGDMTECDSCGLILVYNGLFWEHDGGARRHMPVPKDYNDISWA